MVEAIIGMALLISLALIGIVVNIVVVDGNTFYYKDNVNKILFCLSIVPFLVAIIHLVISVCDKVKDLYWEIWG